MYLNHRYAEPVKQADTLGVLKRHSQGDRRVWLGLSVPPENSVESIILTEQTQGYEERSNSPVYSQSNRSIG